MLVRIIKNWNWPDLLRQTPGRTGLWEGVQFSVEAVRKCNYAVILNHPLENTTIECSPQNIWAIMQEPPNEHFLPMHFGNEKYSRIYTSEKSIRGLRYYHSQPALPWHVNKDYDALIRCNVPYKERNLSWITSNISEFDGHKERLWFLDRIRDSVKFDLYGRGFSYIPDKWDGLAPYRYSIVVENFSNDYYWSEKISDCFLAWCMPIYFGCTRITEYFPADSVACIDITDSNASEKIKDIISSGLWERNLDAIDAARKLVLNKYQLFPFIFDEIHRREAHWRIPLPPKVIELNKAISPKRSMGGCHSKKALLFSLLKRMI